MQLREFLLALTLIPELGIASRQKIWHWLQQENQVELPLTASLMIEIIGANTKQVTVLHDYYLSAEHFKAMAAQDAYITIIDEVYPVALREIYHAPLVLFYRGDLRALQLPLVALVGARQATHYGAEVLHYLMPAVQAAGIGVVSGLARGTDYTVHSVAIAHRAVPIGVIGTGIDVAYPKSSAFLQEKVASTGLLLSEYPNGSQPLKHHFPERNRIIAGLARATVVIEAQERSGSLITANLALQENRNVLAVPGPVNEPSSRGCNELIKAGAVCVTTPIDIIDEVLAY
ncbi:DNA-protecting protein DprA [Periweissella cryptocerci]|uniref:DNA-protecting protein DprA n=1 Tax=Periweissella cryptocerci TaxID=2506420 RepID=A0A4P6YWX0_9LACO|nr:DNA-processing protein DprA [Periweissella cryptocerci]QBO37350.1 DNA-protecting protein DprA [Periweissella cryptocerci]